MNDPANDPVGRRIERVLYATVAGCIVLMLFLSGCATGVVMTDEEKVACRDQGCAAFTGAELRSLIGRVFNDAFRQGWTDAMRQGGKGI